MSQNNYIIADQTTPNFRADLNNALQALASLSSGSSAPSTTYANMLWYDTLNNILKVRTEADDAWISIAYIDQNTNDFRVLDNTVVTDMSGNQTAVIGDQPNSAWQAGSSTTPRLISAENLASAVPYVYKQADSGELGTIGMFKVAGNGEISVNEFVTGANLEWTSATGIGGGGNPSGTWKCLGYVAANSVGAGRVTTFIRTG